MSFTITSRAEKGNVVPQQPPLIPSDHIQVNPDTHPHQTRPIAEVAGWISDPAVRIIFEMSLLARSLKRYFFLQEQIGNPELQDDPRIKDAQLRRDAYLHDARRRIGEIIECEWAATRAWDLLTPRQRVEQGVAELWETSKDRSDLFGCSWTTSHAQALPDAFELIEVMGWQWGPLATGLRLYGRAEYVKRRWLRGNLDYIEADRRNDRTAAIVANAKAKWSTT